MLFCVSNYINCSHTHAISSSNVSGEKNSCEFVTFIDEAGLLSIAFCRFSAALARFCSGDVFEKVATTSNWQRWHAGTTAVE